MRALALVPLLCTIAALGCEDATVVPTDGDATSDVIFSDTAPGDVGIDAPDSRDDGETAADVASDARAPTDSFDVAEVADAGPDGADGVDGADAADVGSPPDCPAEMVLVPAGAFIFGPGPIEAEVYLDHYCIDRTEVSAGAFLDCVDAGGCDGYDSWDLCAQIDANTPQQCRPDRMSHPANYIDWYRAEAYCDWAGKRLPTVQEWEKAARGSDGATYPWGEDITCADAHVDRGPQFDACLGFGGLPDEPVPVGSYDLVPSPFGALNLVGNVREWVDNRADPTMPRTEDDVALTKGGAWYEGENLILPELRDNLLGPGITTYGHGFRCAVTPE